jgi:hypothetical protein
MAIENLLITNGALQYFTLKLQKLFKEKFKKENIVLLFNFTFVILVSENLLSQYEQLLILTHISDSTLHKATQSGQSSMLLNLYPHKPLCGNQVKVPVL